MRHPGGQYQRARTTYTTYSPRGGLHVDKLFEIKARRYRLQYYSHEYTGCQIAATDCSACCQSSQPPYSAEVLQNA